MKPQKKQQSSGFNPDYKPALPEEGSDVARISLIVDLGKQKREFKDPKTDEVKVSESQCCAIFADLVDQTHDYGDKIGEQQIRVMLNGSFKGEIKGVSLSLVPPKVKGGVWTYAPNGLITKLAVSSGCREELIEQDNDTEVLLGKPLMIDIGHKQWTNGEGKEVTFYKYLNCSSVPKRLAEAGITELNQTPREITFDNMEREDLDLIRRLHKQIMRSTEYGISERGKRVQALFIEAGIDDGSGGSQQDQESKKEESDTKPKGEDKKAQKASTEAPKPDIDFDDDIPF